MITFICLFFPSVLALALYEKITKCKISVKKSIYLYCIFNIFINGGCFLIKKYILATGDLYLFEGTDMTPSAAFNYLLITIPLAIICALIASLLKKNVKIEKE